MITADDMIDMLPDDPEEAAEIERHLNLSPAQHNWLCRGECPLQPATFEALARKGLIEPKHNRGITAAGLVYVKRFTNKAFEWLREQVPDGTPFIYDDEALLELLSQADDIDVYVYRGNTPMVVKDGDVQKPLACLHPFYRWQIEVARTHGKFLKRVPITGYKGSYGYVYTKAHKKN